MTKKMNIKQFKYLSKFKCIADKCPDHCCYGWGVEIDPKTYTLYTKKAPELLNFVQQHDCSIKTKGKNKNCLMLKNGLCTVQSKYGTKYMGDTCLLYPRMRNKIDDTLMLSANLSCPEIARLCLYEKDPFSIQKGNISRMSITANIPTGEGYSKHTILNTNQMLIKFCANENIAVEQLVLIIIQIAKYLEILPKQQWPKAIRLLLREHIDRNYTPTYNENNLHMLFHIVVSLHSPQRINCKRLYQILENIASVLQIKLDFDTVNIIFSRNSNKIHKHLSSQWQSGISLKLKEILRICIQAHLAMGLFPYGQADSSFSLFEQSIALVFKFVLMRLALTAYACTSEASLSQDTIITIVQGISKWLDHTNLNGLLSKCREFDLYEVSKLEDIIFEL